MTDRPVVRLLDRATPPHIVTLVLMTGMSALAMNVFLPGLKVMAQDFQTEYWVMNLSIALYLGINAVLQLIVGPLSDRFGRRPVILWGFGIFCVATVGCIYAPSAEMFLVFRMAQAAIVVAMVLSRAVVRDMVPADQAASMIGYVTMGMSIVPMASPAIGGVLIQHFGWQSTFWLLLAAGAFTMALIWLDQGETAQSSGLSFRQQVREYPELLTSVRFWAYALAAAFASGAFFAYLGGAPFVAQEVFGMDEARLGLFFGAPALGYFFGNMASGMFSARLGVNAMVIIGATLSSIGITISLLLFLGHLGNEYTFFGFMTFVGLGNGMVLPNATSGMLSVRPQLAGTASGLGGAMMIGGGAALSALAGRLLTPEAGPYPLLWIMFVVSVLAILAIWVVIRREKRLGLV